MLYYLGKGTEFKKEDCKEYKTIEGAMKAAAKDENFVVWDENGNVCLLYTSDAAVRICLQCSLRNIVRE